MINKFMNSPLENTLAVIVLAVLMFSWALSLILVFRDKPVPANKSWFLIAMIVFALPGAPAVLDLLRTSGLAQLLALAAVVILSVAVIIPTSVMAGRAAPGLAKNWTRWLIPILVAGGFIVAGYLTYVEFSGSIPQCGALSGCSDVQTSKYALLLGFLPVGVLGLAGYFGILAAWLLWQYGPEKFHKSSALLIWGMCLFGVLFSAYLTFLEPFVIGATCMWCITSAVFMILLLWASTPSAQAALAINEEDFLD